MGSVGGPKVTRIGRWLALHNPQALRRHLERWAELPGPWRLAFSHGDDVTGMAAATALRRAVANAYKQSTAHTQRRCPKGRSKSGQ